MSRRPAAGKRSGNLSQYGLLDLNIPGDDEEPMDISDDDMDLEAELAAISGGGNTKKPRPRKPAPVAPENLDAMIAASLRDDPSDDEDVDDGDEDDPDLLSELKELGLADEPTPPARVSRPAPAPPSATAASSTVSLLQDRISNYTIAEKNAKQAGESSKARRFNRGLKTLNDLLKQAKAGKHINDEDIPPPASIGKPADSPAEPPSLPEPLSPTPAPPVPPRAAPAPPSAPECPARPESPASPEPAHPPPPPPTEETLSPEKEEGLKVILKRKEEFKAAALQAKHAGDKHMALEYLKVVKQFDLVVDAYKSGQEMDLSELPTPEQIAAAMASQTEQDHTQGAAEPEPEPTPAPSEPQGLITGATMEEALKLRLAAFQELEAKAKEAGNSSKARRMGRITQQYTEALKRVSRGLPLTPDDLPAPPGHGPLPAQNTGPHPAASPAAAPPRTAPAAPAAPAAVPRPAPSRYEKQIAALVHRQKEFKEAAIRAKKSGNIEQAKEYLRAAKGFDAVIEAARGGLAVDFKSLPLPPNEKTQLENTFDIVSAEDCTPPAEDISVTMEDGDVLLRIQQQLTSQLKLCLDNRDHYRAMGNVAETNRFEHLAVSVKQDIDVITMAKRLGQNPPKFHYESKQFSVVQCNTDLNENDLELTIVRGIAYNVPNPKEIDTYVKFEFPYPQEAPVVDRTSCVKDTNSPEYNAVFPLAIHRGARPCLRVFKRHALKLELYSRGSACSEGWLCCSGWFSRDALLATVSVKLAPLETQCTLHESFPLMDGRRAAGGALEVRLRVRTPLVQQHFETTTHRWLVIDS